MNYTLHQFRKEFRYLRLRWFGFLAVVFFEMAVNLEWVLPMRAGVASPGWLADIPTVVLISGLSLMLSCPEDRPGSDLSFISSRPIPLRSYWLSRLVVWLLLIVVPVVLVNGFYLALSGRPFTDIARGMWERFVLGAGFSAWLVPMMALWQRKEIWKAILILVLVVIVASNLLDLVESDLISYNPTRLMYALGLVLFALLCGVLVWRHLVRNYSFRHRLVLTALAALLSLSATRFGSVRSSPKAQDQDLVNKLEPNLKVDFDITGFRIKGATESYGPSLDGRGLTKPGRKDVHVEVRPHSSVFTQAGSIIRAENNSSHIYGSWKSPQKAVSRADLPLVNHFPKHTLFVPKKGSWWADRDHQETSMAVFSEPHPRFDEPVKIETEFVVDWYQKDKVLEMPLVKGTSAVSDDVRWKILGIKPTKGPNPGAVTLFVQQESRAHWDVENGHAILLHLPNQRLVRFEPEEQFFIADRGANTGWHHSQLKLTWNDILNHTDGEPTGIDLANAKLILLRCRYLGQSRTRWESPEIRLADYSYNRGSELFWMDRNKLYEGRVKKTFKDRIETLKPLTANSSDKEARRYAYNLFTAAAATRAPYTKSVHQDITTAFEPLGRHHLPLMLELRSYSWPGWNTRPPSSLLERFVTEDYRHELVDRAPENPMLADLVLKKGWSDQAKRHLPNLIAAPVISAGARTLLLDWKDDPEVAARLIKAARYDINSYTIKALDKSPETRPRIEALVKEQFEETILLASSTHDRLIVQRAANFGSEDAFEICLRWMRYKSGHIPRFPNLINVDGTDFWSSAKIPSYERHSILRRLQVSDFEYISEKRAWKFLKQ